MKTPLERAIDICGGQTALANSIGLQQPHIWNWVNRSSDGKAPVEYCAAIERATGGKVSRQELRPDDWADIWPELVKQRRKAA